MAEPRNYLYVAPNLADIAVITSDALAAAADRHQVRLDIGPLTTLVKPKREIDRHRPIAGVVLGMERGSPGAAHLRFAAWCLRRNLALWLYWPIEGGVERVDRERIRGYWRLWSVVAVHRLRGRLRRWRGQGEDQLPALASRNYLALHDVMDNAKPVPLSLPDGVPEAGRPIPGNGVYMRLDFWTALAPGGLTSGGSYGHTCYVAKELRAVTGDLICIMPTRFSLLDELGVHQVVLDPPYLSSTEETLMRASWHYIETLTPVMRALRPRYIYERHVIGNFAGAALSQRLNIPYLLEYNGSEVSMGRSFGGARYRFEDVYVKGEDAAFKQATLISVVSQVLKDSLVDRGVDAGKILVNPNGADLEAYRPQPPDVKQALRAEFGWTADERVIGFTGTFGGWHGIDVLAAAIPRICAQCPDARFLLIGDGATKLLVDEAVAAAGLEDRVARVGRVPQQEGARLLGACDIYVSPHNSHMVDSRFFGSPTKLFEYMSMGGGIVGSDLEQLGKVLSPALTASDFQAGSPTVTNQRAILCAPGDVDEFVAAVVALVVHREVCAALGRNARQAVSEHYSWQRHVERNWRFLLKEGQSEVLPAEPETAGPSDAGPWRHVQVPANARVKRERSREWFLEIEKHRYGVHAAWMPETMEFAGHAGHDVLELGGGLGTDLSQFAAYGARVTDLDVSLPQLQLARENFRVRGLEGRFVHYDADTLPFESTSFDLVYSHGVLHHTVDTAHVVKEMWRVLRPGGQAIAMVYAENSLEYFYRLAWDLGLDKERLKVMSMAELMSRYVEPTESGERPLVKVYSARRLRDLFADFEKIEISKRQLVADDLPPFLRRIPRDRAERMAGWNLIIKARKPARP